MIHFMLDLETMGNGNNAAITAIGVVAMDMEKLEVVPADQDGEFYTPVSLASSMEAGLEYDASTILWWFKQSEEARAEMLGRTLPLYESLVQLNYWIAKHVPNKKDRCVWGNGAAQDNVWLKSAYKACGIDVPWTYSGDRCFRTMKNIYTDKVLPPPISGSAHNALNDAQFQAAWLMDIMMEVRR